MSSTRLFEVRSSRIRRSEIESLWSRLLFWQVHARDVPLLSFAVLMNAPPSQLFRYLHFDPQ